MTKNKEKATSGEVAIEQKTGDVQIIAQDNQNFNIQDIITRAIDQKIPVETMERLLAMAERMQTIKAKQEFDKAMASFQAECPIIEKGKVVLNKDKVTVRYKYAPLDSIIKQVGNLLQKNGFSYSTDTKMNGKAIITVKATHILGHSESSTVEIPLQPDAYMTEAQKAMSAVTFGKRYAFCNVFGILTGEEDDDNQNDAQSTSTSHNFSSGNVPPPTYTNDGKIVEKPAHKATKKQTNFIKQLCKQKAINQTQLLEMAKGLNPSQLIERLLAYQSTPQELPTIQQDNTPADVVTRVQAEQDFENEMSEEEKNLVANVPF